MTDRQFSLFDKPDRKPRRKRRKDSWDKKYYNACKKHMDYVDEINGVMMANATLMAGAFNKRPSDIFKTITWQEFETALCIDSDLRLEDIRSVKNGEKGGSWIHQELVVEFARRLNPKFALWCNRRIAELMKNGNTQLRPMSMEEMMIAQLQAQIQTKKELAEIRQEVKEIAAKAITSPVDYFTIAGYASLHGKRVDLREAATRGREASRICKDNGWMTGSVVDPRFGSVKTYPKEALEIAFK